MAILEAKKTSDSRLQDIANTLASSKKVVVITGAGISTNCGIPVSTPWQISLAVSSLPMATEKCCRTSDLKMGSTLLYRPSIANLNHSGSL